MSIRGPWSEPIDLKIGQIDPGHAVGAGRHALSVHERRLPRSGSRPTASPSVGEMKKVYDGWKYPA